MFFSFNPEDQKHMKFMLCSTINEHLVKYPRFYYLFLKNLLFLWLNIMEVEPTSVPYLEIAVVLLGHPSVFDPDGAPTPDFISF